MAICSCNLGWHIRPDDRYCSGCGAPVTAFEPVAASNLIPVEAAGAVVQAEVLIRNTGRAAVDVEVPAQVDSPSASFHGLPWRRPLRIGQEACIQFGVKFETLPEDDLIRKLPIRTSTPGVEQQIIFFKPAPPEVSLRFEEGEQAYVSTSVPTSLRLSLFNARSGFASAVVISPPAWLTVSSETVVIGPFEQRIIECVVQPAKLTEWPAPPVELKVRLGALDPADCADAMRARRTLTEKEWRALLRFKDHHDVKVSTPALAAASKARPQIFKSATADTPIPDNRIEVEPLPPNYIFRARYILKNTGGEDLTLLGLHTSEDPHAPGFVAAFDALAPVIKKSGQLAFQIGIDTRHYAARSEPYEKKILFDFGDQGALELAVTFSVRELRLFDGFLAIDFGTTNSCAAYSKGPFESEVLELAPGKNYIPSVLYFFSDNYCVVGEEAKRWYYSSPEAGVVGIKRLLMQEDRKIHGRSFHPQELVELVMRELVGRAAQVLSRIPRFLAVTVPVDFSPQHRRIIQQAAKAAAGVEDVRVFDEPTAAAMHYVYQHRKEFADGAAKNLVVFDFGGGTLDISVLRVRGVDPQILTRRGDARLGGMDLDRLVACDLAAHVRAYPGFDDLAVAAITSSRDEFITSYSHLGTMRSEFYRTAEEVKRGLSSQPTKAFTLPNTALVDRNARVLNMDGSTGKPHGPLQLRRPYELAIELAGEMTREHVETVVEAKLKRALHVLKNALAIAELPIESVNVVLLTGQVCHMPAVRTLVKNLFEGTEAHIPKDNFDLKTCVALGAAEMAFRKFKYEHPGLSGPIGYLDTEHAEGERFVQVLPENHAYGKTSDVPVHTDFNDLGVLHLPIYRNNGTDNIMTAQNREDFIRIAVVTFIDAARAGQKVAFQLGLDSNGFITAFLDGQPLSVSFEEEENEDAL